MSATEKLDGKIITSTPEQYPFIARFPKTILGKTPGERAELSGVVTADGDAFPLDAVERKLLFGARPGVTLTVVTWFIAYLENALGIPASK